MAIDDFTIHITSELTSSERRVSPDWTIGQLKARLEQITGIAPDDQRLWLYKSCNSKEREEIGGGNGDDSRLLEGLGMTSMGRIHVDSITGNQEIKRLQKDLLEDNPDENLYELDESRYNAMGDTAKRWKEQNRLGRYDPAYVAKRDAKLQAEAAAAAKIKVGDRCKTMPTVRTPIARVGTVRYVGKIPEIDKGEAEWVGVELDEPLGKNDGSIKGVRYFTCKPKYGSVVRPSAITTDFDEDEDEDENGLDEDEL